MNSEFATLILVSWGFTLVIAYCFWAKIRVILLREEIFLVRDELWDQALALGCLDDPAHRQARLRLNGLIRGAGALSLPVMAFAIYQQRAGLLDTESPVSERADMQKAIETAYGKTGKLIRDYIFSCTLTGIIFRLLALLIVKVDLASILRWLKTDGPTKLPSDGHGSAA